ncbi:MAG: response regulator [Thermoanaerobaculia bacterium]
MRKRILLADDSITIQKVVELTFSDGDYEVVAVNNGAKAIQKIAEMKPDIILSDIIMPEKNGYEVCEFVKSHPVYRGIPVILLTGTFEPFDPDRADKAGCDAVVTKPFESQSLIQKVEELIEQSQAGRASEPAAAAAPESEPTPWAEPPAEPESSQFATARPFAAPSFPAEPEEVEPAEEERHDFFSSSSPAPAPPTTEMPYSSPNAQSSGETRAFPRMSFDNPPPAAPPLDEIPDIEPSPWDHNPPPAGGGETRAFPKMTFDDMPRTSSPAEIPTPSSSASSPWDEEPNTGATRAFPQLSFDDLNKADTTPPPAPESADASPWDEPPAPAGETRSFAKMSFDDLRKASTPEPEPSTPPPSPWDEPVAGGETRGLPKMSFDDLPETAPSASASEPQSAWDEAPARSSWESASDTSAEEPAMSDNFAAPPPAPFGGSSNRDAFYESSGAPASEPPSWARSEPVVPPSAPASTSAASPAASTSISGDLTEEQIERIARRVVQMLSDQVVRNIAWEVIPDLAEMVVKERIRQLESEP